MNQQSLEREVGRRSLSAGRSGVEDRRREDRRVCVALIWTIVASVLLSHYGTPGAVLALLPGGVPGAGGADPPRLLLMRLVWAGLHLGMYAAVPVGLAYACGLRARDLGLTRFAAFRYCLVVLAVVAAAFPALLAVSQTSEFCGSYPMFRPSRQAAGQLWLWLGALAAYLFSIELYFRGFLLAMLTPSLGRHAVLVALVPYVATHRYLPEALGSILVGLLLSELRARTGSVWPGYLTHLLIALQIELVALWRHGLL